MASKSLVDAYVNRYSYIQTQVAANTLMDQEIQLGFNITAKYAIVLHRLEFNCPTASTELVAAGDSLQVGITTTPTVTGIRIGEAGCVDAREITCIGAPAQTFDQPIVLDYSSLPGQGLLLPARGIRIMWKSTGFAGVAAMYVQALLTIKELSDADYLELLQIVERMIY